MPAWLQSICFVRRLHIPSPFRNASRRIFLPRHPTGLDHHIQWTADLASCVTPLLRRHSGSTGILNLLTISYAFRPQIRLRLTLGGRTFPRKPWDYGGPDFHGPFRYSCPHNHFHIVHVQLPSRFTQYGTLFYHRSILANRSIRGFGNRFSPDSFRRKITRPVSCYALFK